MAKPRVSPWDLTALLNAADPKASLPERHLWLIRLLEWLRHAPVEEEAKLTPTPVLRLKHLLGVLDRHPEHQARVAELLQCFWREIDSVALFADFGFAPRVGLWGELGRRLRARVLPITPATTDLGELFGLLFPQDDNAAWLLAIDDATLARLRAYVLPSNSDGKLSTAWHTPFLDAIVFLASAVRASGVSPAMRQRMSAELLVDQPFRQLARSADQFSEHAQALAAEPGAPDREARATALLQEAQYLRALLDACGRSADSVHEHLEAAPMATRARTAPT